MGLDMYLRAKTNMREYKGSTGACNGIFPIAPNDYGMVEIGYWRKAYDQQELIKEVINHTIINDHYLITKEEVDTIIERATEIINTHKFDEDGYDLDDGDTFNSKSKWEDTIAFFKEAKKIYEEDPNAEIYYLEWT